eukprot:m.133988 g.133988  ORF g.133988 m.133988 type:complete len:70 (-) comp52436_c0_seq10:478-687(-)
MVILGCLRVLLAFFFHTEHVTAVAAFVADDLARVRVSLLCSSLGGLFSAESGACSFKAALSQLALPSLQ